VRVEWLRPDWPAPVAVRAVSTTRAGGFSSPPYDRLNLGAGAGDDADCVARNRDLLRSSLALGWEPFWLRQVHGTQVVAAAGPSASPEPADASFTDQSGPVCVVLTADCLPVLFCDRAGTVVAAAHAGWRGLAAGVLEATLDAMSVSLERTMAWLGPAIGPRVFEVGDEVRSAFLNVDAGAGECFRESPRGRWLANLPELARRRLRAAGVDSIHGGHWCTYENGGQFFSHRRDRGLTGRMATLIWLAES
jgi:hypothetical protein